jgi:cyclohexadieny/prephenate dehydrogenase
MRIKNLTIVGVGLIGGSIGLAAKRRGVALRVRGVGRQWPSLESALKIGAIDEGFLDISEGVAEAEVVVFCTPVDRILEQILGAGQHYKFGALVTDAGSTKANIVRFAEGHLPNGARYVGSHPLAGSEKRGPEFADADLFQDRLTVVTQTEKTDPDALERTKSFWQALGSRVRVLDPVKHDEAVALTSHLPHLVAAALAGMLPPQFHELTAGGFRDTTRIAAGDPELWTAIFSQNRDAVLHEISAFDSRLSALRVLVEAQEWTALKDHLAQAKKVRDALGS